ncbi:calcium/calmodulin-dependent protein kinase II gamma, isoform CRA_d [Rattus norvegicus]|uniref:Calcium/calmodulin-dependent protein kinase II gamma, isoform CRA_d n=1 Tax=Rattus norvegicus TaxID=10116 RepID=A6KKQ6_RAT|nr:calcium/calmodulin-dependent protein kinase II gamma, isoform CRA_d [Rattus norvegicus]
MRLSTDQLKYRLFCWTICMGITPSPACTQKGVQSQGSCSHCPSLCSRSSFPGGKDLYLRQITEKTMEEQLVIVLVPSHPTAAHYLHFGGEGGLTSALWMTFREAQELGKDTELQTLEPAEKRTNSWVLVLEFSQAPQAPCACLRPWTLAPSCPAACSASQQIPSPQGLVLLA